MNIATISAIITHPGRAHKDDLIATCLLMAVCKGRPTVYRRVPTPAEMDDPNTAIVDQGNVYDAVMANFDHHQLSGKEEPRCAVSQVLEGLGLLEKARRHLPWLVGLEILDDRGPVAFRHKYGLTEEAFESTSSPLEGQLLKLFANKTEILPNSDLWGMLQSFGADWLRQIDAKERRLADLPNMVSWLTLGGVEVARVLCSSGAEPTLCLEAWLKQVRPDVPVTITEDGRGSGGLALYRRAGFEGVVDFSKVAGMPGVTFVPRGGWLAKVEKTADIDALMSAAKITPPVPAGWGELVS